MGPALNLPYKKIYDENAIRAKAAEYLRPYAPSKGGVKTTVSGKTKGSS